MTSNDPNWLSTFVSPPGEYRSMPLWVWNGAMSKARITQMLEQFAARGMGGVFVHPRPGLIAEYLGDEWFELWGFALAECKRLGLLCNIYDENSYPAGFAGGHVPSRYPETAAQYLDAMIVSSAPVRVEGELLTAYYVTADSGPGAAVAREDLDLAVLQGPVLLMQLRRAGGRAWTAGFPYVDLCRADIAAAFLETTYVPHEERFGSEFGKAIRWSFCDEPMLGFGFGAPCKHPISMSREIVAEFQKQHGYDLLPRIADLALDTKTAFATRFDYQLTLQRLWTQNFMKPMHDWCTARNLEFTGHFMEHAWPEPYFQPSSMHAFQYFHAPGIDLLAPQFKPHETTQSGHYLMSIKEVASVARQLGKARVVCEAHGVGGWEATFQDFKRLADWLLVHGVNLISEHLSFETIAGARKYDHPQSFSDHSAWWEKYRILADHQARLAYALTRGERIARLLVLQPTTTAWCYANPIQPDTEMAKLGSHQWHLIQWLADHQVDFDLGDELLVREHGSVTSSARLKIGVAEYQLVVVPAGMSNWCDSTLDLIATYIEAGGQVLALGELPHLINGRPDQRCHSMANKHPTNWIKIEWLEHQPSDFRHLQSALDAHMPPLITTAAGDHLPNGIHHHARNVQGGTLHFLVNLTGSDFRAALRLNGSYLYGLDTFTGEHLELAAANAGEFARTVEIHLPAAGHALVLACETPLSAAVDLAPVVKWKQLPPPSFVDAARTQPNVLGIDFCDLALNGSETRNFYVTKANQITWQAHGFDQDVWDRGVQFRRNYLDRSFHNESGFKTTFRFAIAGDACETITADEVQLAIERAELYQVAINGRPVSFANAQQWFDESMSAVSINELLQPGMNRITLRARPFHILCEIDRVYIIGNFGLRPATSGFELTSMPPLTLGDWTEQGLIMYDKSVRYNFELRLDAPCASLKIRLPNWSGSVASVCINDEQCGLIAFPPYELVIPGPHSGGPTRLSVEITGTPKNLLGPHFHPLPPDQRWCTPYAWDKAPSAQPPGADYEILPYGLLDNIEIYAQVDADNQEENTH